MVQKFNKGDVVIAYPENVDLDQNQYFMAYGVTPTNQPLLVSACDHTFVYFFGADSSSSNGWLQSRFRKVDDAPNEVIEEPDLHVYPDTPVGTELIITQDTLTRHGTQLLKGYKVLLALSDYSKCGGYRHVIDEFGCTYLIDCDHLMISWDSRL